MIKQLSAEEQERLHHRYRNNEIFRHWSPLLYRMEWEMQELDLITLWSVVESVLRQLRNEKENREEMIQFIFRQLLKDFRTVEDEFGDRKLRTAEQAECSAVTVMSIVLTLLMNAVENGHEDEDFDNQPMCVALAAWIRSHPHFQFLMEDFFARRKGYDGKKVVFKPSDPMKEETMLEGMSEELRQEIEEMIGKVIGYTGCLESLFGDRWTYWRSLWRSVCLDHELLMLLKEVSPNRNDWGINQKMICNVIGIFCLETEMEVTFSTINKTLSDKQLGSYLRNHAGYNQTDCALTREQHKRIEEIIKGFLSA